MERADISKDSKFELDVFGISSESTSRGCDSTSKWMGEGGGEGGDDGGDGGGEREGEGGRTGEERESSEVEEEGEEMESSVCVMV